MNSKELFHGWRFNPSRDFDPDGLAAVEFPLGDDYGFAHGRNPLQTDESAPRTWASAQACRSSREYRTLRPSFRKGGPSPEARNLASVDWPRFKNSAASFGLRS